MDNSQRLSFAGALIGAVLGTPIIRLFEDWLFARRRWKNRRQEIIVDLRSIIANIDAFWELKDLSHGEFSKYMPDRSQMYAISLRHFDLAPLQNLISRVAELAPGDSGRSQSAQWLVSNLTQLLGLMKQISMVSDQLPPILNKEADNAKEKIQTFIMSIYSKRMNIEGMSFLYDPEISAFNYAWNDQIQKKIDENLKSSIKEYEKLSAEGSQVIPSP